MGKWEKGRKVTSSQKLGKNFLAKYELIAKTGL